MINITALQRFRTHRGTSYWFKYIITTPNQLTAAALVIQYWVPRDHVNPGVFIAVFLVAILCINYFGIRFFGEFEFWLSSIKVVIIVGLILLSFILALGGGPDHDRKGFRYWKDPGAFNTYIEGIFFPHTSFGVATWVLKKFLFQISQMVPLVVSLRSGP